MSIKLLLQNVQTNNYMVLVVVFILTDCMLYTQWNAAMIYFVSAECEY